jgi:heme A synthase
VSVGKQADAHGATGGTLPWIYLGYLLAVVLFGAWVRISGSGDGCGSHWPVCNGEVIPPAPSVKTMIEFTHRLTSGLCGLFGIGLLFWARRQPNLLVFRAALASFAFLLLEGFIGAVLVKRQLVANDASASRAIVVGLHLANTLLLTASTALAGWWSRERTNLPVRLPVLLFGLLLAALVAVNITGAVTALGDTLFPRQPALDGSLWAEVRADLSPSHHFLVRLRILHPVVAAFTAGFALLLFWRLSGNVRLVQWARWLVAAQVGLGLANVALAAPGWMQIAHLLTAQGVWIAAVLVMAQIRNEGSIRSEGST